MSEDFEYEQRTALEPMLNGQDVGVTEGDLALSELLYTMSETGMLGCGYISYRDAILIARAVKLASTMNGKCPDVLRM